MRKWITKTKKTYCETLSLAWTSAYQKFFSHKGNKPTKCLSNRSRARYQQNSNPNSKGQQKSDCLNNPEQGNDNSLRFNQAHQNNNQQTKRNVLGSVNNTAQPPSIQMDVNKSIHIWNRPQQTRLVSHPLKREYFPSSTQQHKRQSVSIILT